MAGESVGIEPQYGMSESGRMAGESVGIEPQYGTSENGRMAGESVGIEPQYGKEPRYGKGSSGSGQSGPVIPRHAGAKRGPRESRPEFGRPGGIYGPGPPGGGRLPAHVFYRATKQRYQARVRRVDGKQHRDLADAVAEASALCSVPA